MLKKGFNLFKPVPSIIYDWVFKPREPMCCEVCKGCLFNIGKLICKYRKATIKEFSDDCLKRK